jgi:hypothetical protein
MYRQARNGPIDSRLAFDLLQRFAAELGKRSKQHTVPRNGQWRPAAGIDLGQ